MGQENLILSMPSYSCSDTVPRRWGRARYLSSSTIPRTSQILTSVVLRYIFERSLTWYASCPFLFIKYFLTLLSPVQTHSKLYQTLSSSLLVLQEQCKQIHYQWSAEQLYWSSNTTLTFSQIRATCMNMVTWLSRMAIHKNTQLLRLVRRA
jgi:hypothetical protein